MIYAEVYKALNDTFSSVICSGATGGGRTEFWPPSAYFDPHLTWLQHGHDCKSSFIELSIKNKYQAFFGASRIISDKFFNYFSFLT